jgi:putative heme-binding domain-containing protein
MSFRTSSRARCLGSFPASWEVFILALCCIASLLSFDTRMAQAEEEATRESLFDGKTLNGWKGNERLWAVEDGAITGQTTKEEPIDANTFLVFQGDPLSDFELQLDYRIEGGNSGIQYRSHLADAHPFSVGGYQADIDAGNEYTGILYEERGRGILASRGEQVKIAESGEKSAKRVADSVELAKSVRQGAWNRYRIVAQGEHLQHFINDILMSETFDHQKGARAEQGILALQLHAGPPMKVQFRDIQLMRISAGTSRVEGKEDQGASSSRSMLGTEGFSVAKGFKAELIYEVPRDTEGSWVSLCVDPRGRLLASDQYGKVYRITPPPIGESITQATLRVEPLTTQIGMLQGMCWVGDRFYVVVNGDGIGGNGSGLYLLQDLDRDDQFESVRLLRAFEGEGEHGPHAVVAAPDGKSLYVLCGNHTKLTTTETSRVPRLWQEDQLLPRMWDASGHAVGILAPGGYVCRTDLEGSRWELFSIGYRNAYDMTFNDQGDLFTYDSDMEWDLGAPWYRPTRICHVTSGSEFGWRSGSGNWPSQQADSLPPMVELGTGSPTGVSFGYGAHFPEKYQKALYACDWSFGKVYAIHMTPQGGTYSGEVEEFLTGTPLPITDIVVNQQDGALYFAVGGRKTFSALYRVVYAPTESATEVPLAGGGGSTAAERNGVSKSEPGSVSNPPAMTALALRKELERFHGIIDPTAVPVIWQAMGHPDRFVRYAARTALEWQPTQQWVPRLGTSRGPWQLIEGTMAAARTCRQHDPDLAARLANAIVRLPWMKLSAEQQRATLRALELVFLRVSPKDPHVMAMINSAFSARFPTNSTPLTMAMAQLLAYTEDATYIEKALGLMEHAMTQEERIHYAYTLRPRMAGARQEEQDRYFAWFTEIRDIRGGYSLRKFLHNMREEAAKDLSAVDRARLEAVLAYNILEESAPETLAAGPVVKEYSLAEIIRLAEPHAGQFDLEAGRAAFSKALCFRCHRVGMEGGATGPDLTSAARRFDARYLAESTHDPDKEISDRFRSSQFIMEDGRVIVGRVANLNHDNVMVITNMFDPGSTVELDRKEIEEVHAVVKSEMPSGLLNTLSEEEIRHLFDFMRSAGNPPAGVAQADRAR